MEFVKGAWNEGINVRDFIVNNYTPYDGDESFLAAPTERTRQLWDELCVLLEAERKAPGRVLDADTKVISSITAHEAGYINKDLEVIVGLQTEKPLKRAIMPFGGVRMVEQSLEEHGFHMDPEVKKIFKYRHSHKGADRRCQIGVDTRNTDFCQNGSKRCKNGSTDSQNQPHKKALPFQFYLFLV